MKTLLFFVSLCFVVCFQSCISAGYGGGYGIPLPTPRVVILRPSYPRVMRSYPPSYGYGHHRGHHRYRRH